MKTPVQKIKDQIQRIQNMSQIRLFAIVAILLVLPISIISVFSFTTSINEARSRYIDTLSMETQQLAGTLSAEMGNILSVGRMIVSDNNVRHSLDEYRLGRMSYEEANQRLSEILGNYEERSFMSSSMMPKISLITKENQHFGNSFNNDTFTNEEFLSELLSLYSTNQNVKWTSDTEMYSLKKHSRSDRLYLMLALRESSTFRTIGVVVIQVRSNMLAIRILPNMYDYQTTVVTNKNGRRITEYDYLHTAEEFDNWVSGYTIDLLNERAIEKKIGDMDCVITKYAITSTGWYLFTISDMFSFRTMKERYIRNLLLSVIPCLLISAFLAFNISKSFMKPVIELNNRMKMVKSGNLNVHLKPSSSDEIGELTQQFNDMIDRIRQLMMLREKEQEEKRNSDIRFLQSQINPHFLYNTMTILRYSISTGNKEQSDRIILALNRILRYVLSDSNQMTTLNHAIEWIRSYVVILNCSLPEPVKVTYDLEEGTGDYRIMRMLIQPLVENAAFHGLKKSSSPPELQIRSKTQDGDLIISIYDNGPGFDTGILTQCGDSLDHQSIGIINVNQRMKLFYGDGYGVTYRSTNEGLLMGTEAIVRLPIITTEGGEVLINEHSDR